MGLLGHSRENRCQHLSSYCSNFRPTSSQSYIYITAIFFINFSISFLIIQTENSSLDVPFTAYGTWSETNLLLLPINLHANSRYFGFLLYSLIRHLLRMFVSAECFLLFFSVEAFFQADVFQRSTNLMNPKRLNHY